MGYSIIMAFVWQMLNARIYYRSRGCLGILRSDDWQYFQSGEATE